MKIKIKVTKDVLRRSMWCPEPSHYNCAIALAIRDIMPNASVTSKIRPGIEGMFGVVPLPNEALDFITAFDLNSPELRMGMSELDFEIDLPESVVEAINIDDIHKSATLEVVQG